MRHVMLLAAATFAIAACGVGDEEGSSDESRGSTATASQAIFGWTPWVSEEQPAGTTCGDDTRGATRAACSGSYCDNMRLFCGTLPQGFTNIPGTANDSWGPYFSEEGGIFWLCNNAILDGIRATGQFSDNVSIHCAKATYPSQGMNCDWSPWFSEEQGQQDFDLNPWSYAWAVAAGARCSNSFCDNMSYWICEPKCRSNADCFGACVNGVCVVG